MCVSAEADEREWKKKYMAFGAPVRYDYSKNMAYHINQMTYSKNLIEFPATRALSRIQRQIYSYGIMRVAFPKVLQNYSRQKRKLI